MLIFPGECRLLINVNPPSPPSQIHDPPDQESTLGCCSCLWSLSLGSPRGLGDKRCPMTLLSVLLHMDVWWILDSLLPRWVWQTGRANQIHLCTLVFVMVGGCSHVSRAWEVAVTTSAASCTVMAITCNSFWFEKCRKLHLLVSACPPHRVTCSRDPARFQGSFITLSCTYYGTLYI